LSLKSEKVRRLEREKREFTEKSHKGGEETHGKYNRG